MKKLTLVLTLLTLSACGSDDSSPSVALDPATEVQGIQSPHDPLIGARLKETLLDRGLCTEENLQQLIYVIESDQFYYCGKTKEWIAVEIKGTKGETGADGAPGRDGRDGSQGVAGRDGAMEEDLPDNEWEDPVTGQRWVLGQYMNPLKLGVAMHVELPICAEGTRVATDAEMITAGKRGLISKFEGTHDLDSSNSILIYNATALSTEAIEIKFFQMNSNSTSLRAAQILRASSGSWTSLNPIPSGYTICVLE